MFRHLAPSGHTIRAREIATACLAMFSADAPALFSRKIAALLGGRHCFLTSSGTAALYLSLAGLSKLSDKRAVVFPAYTCPSLLAAVIRAGLKPVLCDLEHNRSTMNLDDLAGKIDGDTLAVISVHLFGIREHSERINALTVARGIFHIEDAAQFLAGAAADHQDMLRSRRRSDVVVASFGRGKPLNLLQGGALVTDSDAIAEAVRGQTRGLRQQDAVDTARLVLQSLIYALFFHPRFYWIARRIPFLRLGKTIFDTDFAIKDINRFTCALGNRLLSRMPRTTIMRRQKENLLSRALTPLADRFLARDQDGAALIRFPFIMEDHGQRERVLAKLEHYGLGATSMYEAPLHIFSETKKYFPCAAFPNAQSFSERILTLPLHEYVSERDIDAMCSIIRQALNKNH